MVKTLREKHPEETLNILVAKRNSGSFTYDGIELGGERVCQEIEEEIEKLAREGQEIKKLSVVGYSLGGLVARYAIGLLDSRGLFDKVQPLVCLNIPFSMNETLLTASRPSLLLRPLISVLEHRYAVGTTIFGTSLVQGLCLCLVDNFL